MRAAPSCAICYVTDPTFLVPTLVSAYSALRWTKPSAADIFIFTLEITPDVIEKTRVVCERDGITVIPMDASRISGFDPKEYSQTHVPTSALGRFFLTEYLPPGYDRIVYIDGDTWVIGDISALVEYTPPEGKLVAAEDSLYFFRQNFGSMGENAREYLAKLKLDASKGYFNSGVLLATTDTWRKIMADAFAFFRSNTSKCRYHDQSALNAVTQGRRLRLSPRWNFQTPYRHWGVEKTIDPRIYHFVGGGKPWMGRSEPWSAIHDAYMRDFIKFKHLSIYKRLTPAQLERVDAKEKKHARRLRSIYLLRKLRYKSEMRKMTGDAVVL